MMRSGAVWLLAATLSALVCAGCSDSAADVNSSDAKARKRAIDDLRKRDNDVAAQTLATVTSHDDVNTAREAVRALSRMTAPAAARAMARVAREDKRPEVRMEAAVGLAYQPAAEATQALRDMVQSEPDPAVRGAAAASLGRAGAFRDALLLLAQAEKEQDLAAQTREVAALEFLVGLRFGFNPKDPPEKRRKAIENIKRMAPMFVKKLETYSPVKKGPISTGG